MVTPNVGEWLWLACRGVFRGCEIVQVRGRSIAQVRYNGNNLRWVNFDMLFDLAHSNNLALAGNDVPDIALFVSRERWARKLFVAQLVKL